MQRLIRIFLLLCGLVFALSSRVASEDGAADARSVSANETTHKGELPTLVFSGEKFGNISEIIAALNRRSPVLSVAFAADGNTLASGSEDKTIRLWDVRSGKELRRLEGHTGSVTSVAFAPDGRTLVTGSEDNTIRLWDVATGKELRRLEGHTDSVSSVAFAPDGHTVASGSNDKTIRLWDVVSGQDRKPLEGHTDRVRSVVFAPDGRTLASGSDDKTIRLWDVASGTQLRVLEGPSSVVSSVAFAPDGRTLASGSEENTIWLWDLAGGKKPQPLQGHTSLVLSVAFAPDGRTLASGSNDNTIRLWDVATGKELRRLEGHTRAVQSVAFAPDGRTLASGSQDKTIRLWDIASGRELRHPEGQTDSVSSVAFTSDGHTLASGSGDNTIRLWDVVSGKELRRLEGHKDSVWSVAFAPDGRTLASASGDKTVRLWDVASGKTLRRLEGHTKAVRSVAFAPDGRMLASGSTDKSVRLWDVASGKELRRLEDTNPVLSVAFAPDGRKLASGSDDGIVRLWDIASASGKELRHWELERPVGQTAWVWSVAFSPDSRILAAPSYDNTIRLWDVSGGKERRLEGHTDPVLSVAFAPDGRTLASGSGDKTIRLWDVVSGTEIRRLEGHADWVRSVAFAPDGRTLASGSDDSTVQLWDVASGKELALMAGGQGRLLLLCKEKQGLCERQTKLFGSHSGLWLSCKQEDRLCWRADDGTLFVRPDANGLLHPVPPQGQRLDADLPDVNFPPMVEVSEGKTAQVKFELHNRDGKPLYWLNIRAEPTGFREDAPTVAFHQPDTIMRLDPGRTAIVKGWLVVSFPYLSPKPTTLTLALTLEDAGGRRIALDPIKVLAKSPELTVEEAHLSTTEGGAQSITATLVNHGSPLLNGFATRAILHDAQSGRLSNAVLGSGSSPSADSSAPPTLDQAKKTAITFAVPNGVALPGKPALDLAVNSVDFPYHEWKILVPVTSPRVSLGLIVAAVLIVLAGFILIYYQATYRNPLLVGVSANPAQLLKLDVVQLAAARSLLARTRRLDWALRKADIAPKSFDDAVRTLSSPDPSARAELLARKLGARIKTDPMWAGDLAHVYVLTLPVDFKLDIKECLLVFPASEAGASDVLTAWRQSDHGGDQQTITIILSSDSEQREQFQRQLDKRTESVLVFEQGDETSLLIGSKPLETLARFISARISLKRISPYQINTGVERDTVFFGRTDELRHILNRPPANYLIVGARQLGKSSLLLAIKRRVQQRGDLICEYVPVGLDKLELAIAPRIGLDQDAGLDEIVRTLRNQADQRPRLFLLDECDAFIEADSKRSPSFPVLDALRILSAEGRCYFILAGFWKLFEMASDSYFAPIRNFGETLPLGPLEPEACRALLTEPMETIGIRYADSGLVKEIMDQTGRRPNLIQIVCRQMIREIGQGRVIDEKLVKQALSSTAVDEALGGWRSFTSDQRASRIDRILVYAMLDEDSFTLSDVFNDLESRQFPASTEELRTSLQRLSLAFILSEDRGRFSWRIPLFRDRRRLDEPERQIADELAA